MKSPSGEAVVVTASFAECRAMTRHHARSFYFSSHVLPPEKRKSAYALYAYCRHADDAVDLAPNAAARHLAIRELRTLTTRLWSDNGDEGLPLWGPAFVKTVKDHGIPRHYFEDLLHGIETDQGRVRIATWPELETYCYHVASVVGLMMTRVFMPVWREDLEQPAKDLGTAMQLTNILRDVAEDRDRDRIYLPEDELRQFGIDEEVIIKGRNTPEWTRFMEFQVARARDYYRRSEMGIRELPGDGSRWTVWMMRGIYAGILEEIEKVEYNVFRGRVSVPFWRKVTLGANAWRQSRGCDRVRG